MLDDFVPLKHLLGYIIPWAGNLMEEKSCVFNKILKYDDFGSYYLLKIESSDLSFLFNSLCVQFITKATIKRFNNASISFPFRNSTH
jgi:hypothetical protein